MISTALRADRSKAVMRLVWRVAFTVMVVVAFTAYQLTIEEQVQLGGESAQEVYAIAIPVVVGILAIGLLRAMLAIRRATRAVRSFEEPARQFRQAERQRHQEALLQYDAARQRYDEAVKSAANAAAAAANGPLWFPVAPATEPTRVDVIGGDPMRHGWASLLVTLGTSVLSAGHRVTVLDLTGHDVGGGLAAVARCGGRTTGRTDLGLDSTGVDLLAAVARTDLAECLANALVPRQDNGEQREERVFVTNTVQAVVDCVDNPVTLRRLAVGAHVLRSGVRDSRLSDGELSRLIETHIAEITQDEWTRRHLRILTSQLDTLSRFEPQALSGRPLWTGADVALVATPGGRSDHKDLVDRLLLQLALDAVDRGWLGGVLVVAGGDRLGADSLEILSDRARHARVRTVVMIDQPQGAFERSVGTGGAVCVMKMYNHRDATVAAEFIGKGHRFVINQVTRQVGMSFSDGGGDSFASSSSDGRSGDGVNESRGRNWTETRNWNAQDNISTSTSSGRVHEFIVEAEEIRGMPETSFILVDNSGAGRRVILADGNPGICLRDRVSRTPASGSPGEGMGGRR